MQKKSHNLLPKVSQVQITMIQGKEENVELSIKNLLTMQNEYSSVWCPLKGHTYLKNLQVSAADVFRYTWPCSAHQTLKD